MADSNPYAALTENDNGGIDQNYEEIDSSLFDYDNFSFKSLKPDVKVEIPNGDLGEKTFRLSPSLLACSSTFGYLVAGNCSGFVLVQTQKLRATVLKSEKGKRTPLKHGIQVNVTEGKVLTVNLSQDQLQILVAVSGGKLLVYNVHDIVTKNTDIQSVQTIHLGDQITYVRSDSQSHPDIIAVGTKNNDCKIIQYMTNQTLATIPNSTAFCWSPLGNQIACGSKNGDISVYDIKGNKVNEIQSPPEMKAGYKEEKYDRYTNGVLWIDENVLLAIYARPKEDDYDYMHSAYIINVDKQDINERFILLEEDLNPIFTYDGGPDSHFYFTILRNFGPHIKTLIITANSGSLDMSVVGQSMNGTWSVFDLENKPSPPLNETEGDTYFVGLAVDYSASETLPPLDVAEDDTPVAPFPVLFFSNNDGVICSYHIYDKGIAKTGHKYSGMVVANDVHSIPLPEPVKAIPVPEQTPPAQPTTASKAIGFNGPEEIPSFSSLPRPEQPKEDVKEVVKEETLAPSVQPVFGATSSFGSRPLGFSTPAQTTPFANLQRSLSDKAKIPAGSGFSTSAFGTKDVQPTFGASSFGNAAPGTGAPSAPAFGGFKGVQMNNNNLFGAKSFVSDSSSSSTMFAPSILEGNSTTSPFAPPPPPPTLDEPPRKIEETDIKTSKYGEPRKSAFAQPIEPVLTKKSSDDFSFEDLKRTVEEGSDTESSRVSSIHGEHEDDGVSLDMSSESSGVNITKDQLIEGDSISEDGQLNEEDQVDPEEEAARRQQREAEEALAREQREAEEAIAREKREAEELARKKQEEEEAARKKEEEEKQRKLKEEEERRRAEEEAKRREEERLAEEKRIAEQRERERLEAEKREAERLERERLEAERREQERLERIEKERLEAIKNTVFAHAEKKDRQVTLSKRSTGLHPTAEAFERVYFETNEALEWNHNKLLDAHEEIAAQSKTSLTLLKASALTNQEQVWKIGDSGDISIIADALVKESEAGASALNTFFIQLADLTDAGDRLESKKDIIAAYLDENDFSEPLDGIDMCEELEVQHDELEDKTDHVVNTLKLIEDQLDELKQKTNKPASSVKKENLSVYSLRRATRDIEQSIKKQQARLLKLEELELKADPSEAESEEYLSRASKRTAFLNTIFNNTQPKYISL